ncbi:hypothetical protein AVEN_142874-1 [Araneus ventricosus]|uniref:Uncharacterized protein n=1 Tax=Araneus ventricosus TaxID=182803 RepID=A0A4Y2L8P0_ARAVE|nr:hypothetical protein AVEN_142874-1 [Araneus ventricosus]
MLCPWSPGRHPNGNPVTSRHSIACFRHSRSDAFLQCLQSCWHWGCFVLHIISQEEITWSKIWRPGEPAQQKERRDPPCLTGSAIQSTHEPRGDLLNLFECMYLVMYHPSL